MRRGMSPTAAAQDAIKAIAEFYPTFSGAIIAVNATGGYSAASNGLGFPFRYTVYNPTLGNSTVVSL